MKSSFPKHNLPTWHWQCKLTFWNGAYGEYPRISLMTIDPGAEGLKFDSRSRQANDIKLILLAM